MSVHASLINDSLKSLFERYPTILSLPKLSVESSEKLTFIGFSFSGRPKIVSKYYFRPEQDPVHLQELTPSPIFRTQLLNMVEKCARYGCSIYDCSIERENDASESLRFVCSIPYDVRCNPGYLETWLLRILTEMGFDNASSVPLSVNRRLQSSLNSFLQPMYLIGGCVNPNGGMTRLKVNFDADIVENDNISHRRPVFDNHRALEGIEATLDLFLDSKKAVGTLDWSRRLVKASFKIHMFGLNVDRRETPEFKIYFQRYGSAGAEGKEILKELMLTHGIVGEDILPAVSNRLVTDGWEYWGVCIALQEGGIAGVKLYLRPMEY